METGKILRMDQPKRPVADPERLYRHCYRIQNKQVVMLNDSVALATPKTYFANDSVKLFKIQT